MNRFPLIALLFMFSCNNTGVNSLEKPADLIPEDKMIQVLADVHLLEAALVIRFPMGTSPTTNLPPDFKRDSIQASFTLNSESKYPLSYWNFFKKEGVTKKQYESSMKWYCSDPEEMSRMYDEVIIELTKRQTKARGK